MEKKIIDFLKSHDLISIYALESKCELPEGTLSKALKGIRGLPDKYHIHLINELKKYGFGKKIRK